MSELENLFVVFGHQILLFVFFGSVAIILVIEGLAPFRKQEGGSLTRWFNNVFLSILNQWAQLYLAPLLVMFLGGLSLSSGSLLSLFHANFVEEFLITLVGLEFVGYWWHRLSHKNALLWRLHAVHHSDVDVDATTALRHHPAEIIMGNLINVFVIMAIGAQPMVVLACSLTSVAIDAFTHGNISLGKVERWIGLFIVTPGFHRVHHCADKEFTDSNFSNNFPWFDYLFGTARYRSSEEQALMPLGLEYFRGYRNSWIDRLLLQPLMSRS